MPLEPTSYAVPQNPNAALMDYRIQGPMAGLMVGEQEAALDRAKQQQQIQNNNANAMNDILVSQTQKDVPLMDATRENKLAEQAFIKTNQQQIDESKVMEMMSKKSTAERQMASDRAEAYVAVGQSMPSPDDDSPAAKAKYQALRSSQSAEVQAKLPPDWSPQTHAFVTGLMGQSKVIMTANAKIAEEKVKGDLDLKKAETAGKYHVEAAKIMADAQSGKGDPQRKSILEIQNKIERGEPLTQEDILKASSIETKLYDKNNPEIRAAIDKQAGSLATQLAQDMGSNNPEAKARVASDVAKSGLKGADATNPVKVATALVEKAIDAKNAEMVVNSYSKANVVNEAGKPVPITSPEGKEAVTKMLGGTYKPPKTQLTASSTSMQDRVQGMAVNDAASLANVKPVRMLGNEPVYRVKVPGMAPNEVTEKNLIILLNKWGKELQVLPPEGAPAPVGNPAASNERSVPPMPQGLSPQQPPQGILPVVQDAMPTGYPVR